MTDDFRKRKLFFSAGQFNALDPAEILGPQPEFFSIEIEDEGPGVSLVRHRYSMMLGRQGFQE